MTDTYEKVARINRDSVKVEINGAIVLAGVDCTTLNVSFRIDVSGVLSGVEPMLRSMEWGLVNYRRVKDEALFRELDIDVFLDEVLKGEG